MTSTVEIGLGSIMNDKSPYSIEAPQNSNHGFLGSCIECVLVFFLFFSVLGILPALIIAYSATENKDGPLSFFWLPILLPLYFSVSLYVITLFFILLYISINKVLKRHLSKSMGVFLKVSFIAMALSIILLSLRILSLSIG